MAHEIVRSKSTGKYEMAYVGATPWHGLGQPLSIGASLDVWKREAGFDWVAKTATVNYFDDIGGSHTFDDRVVIYRSDTKQPISVMSGDYKIVQPMQVLEFFREITEAGGYHIHTAGIIGGGKKVWVLASNGMDKTVGKGDRMLGNILLATSLDGSTATVATPTAIRVVCANTLRIALNAAFKERGAIKTSHRTVFDGDAVLAQMMGVHEGFDALIEKAKTLSEVPVSLEQARTVLRDLMGNPRFTKDGQAKDKPSVDAVMNLFMGAARGADLPGVKGTLWGLLNATTEQVDHHAGRSDSGRLDSAWYGRGAELKTDAFNHFLKIATGEVALA